jgi:hypothetical protein
MRLFPACPQLVMAMLPLPSRMQPEEEEPDVARPKSATPVPAMPLPPLLKPELLQERTDTTSRMGEYNEDQTDNARCAMSNFSRYYNSS